MADVPTVSKDELLERVGRVQLVNVLEQEYDHLGMIRGSKRIPLSQLEARMGELEPGKEVVVYCASYDCDASRKAAALLEANGYNVHAYEGGIREWTEAGLPFDPAGGVKDASEIAGMNVGAVK